MKIKILTQAAANTLKKYVATDSDLGAFRTNRPDLAKILGKNFSHETSIDINGDAIAKQIKMPKGNVAIDDNSGSGDDDKKSEGNTYDADNSAIVYRALANLTPQQATDERLWLYLTNCELWKYARARWPLPEDLDKRRRQIKLHYLVPSNRGLIRNNAIARLWWMGFVANRCNKFGADKALEILLHKSDVRANLLERPTLAASGEIFNGVMQMLGDSYNKDKELFVRDNFRTMMKMLNRAGGRRMLNMLGENGVYKMCKQFAGDNARK